MTTATSAGPVLPPLASSSLLPLAWLELELERDAL
jgi:hypothetical protein